MVSLFLSNNPSVLKARIAALENELAAVKAERDQYREQLDSIVWLDDEAPDPLPPMRFSDTVEHGIPSYTEAGR